MKQDINFHLLLNTYKKWEAKLNNRTEKIFISGFIIFFDVTSALL